MMTDRDVPERSTGPTPPLPETGRFRPRPLAVGVLNYLTNHLVNRVPSYRVRHVWYRRALGVQLHHDAGIHLGCYLWFYGPGQIRRSGVRIGAKTRVNRDCTLDVRGPLSIGDNVSISPEVVILTTQHSLDAPGFPTESRAVVIEDHVWIGMRAMVLPGTTIGRGAVVAAGAVVRGEIPPLTVVAGVPARPVATRPEAALDYDFDWPFPLFE